MSLEWSMYSTCFKSERFGFFIYNSLSNTLSKIKQSAYKELEHLKPGDLVDGRNLEAKFREQLSQYRYVVNRGEDSKNLNALKIERREKLIDRSRVELHICPTTLCNFRCPYCYEQLGDDTATMNSSTVTRLVEFIQDHLKGKHLSILWYGGEPLLAFGLIKDITSQIQTLDVDFRSASIVTNAYHLTEEVRGGSVRLNSFLLFYKWIRSLFMLRFLVVLFD